MYICIYIYVYLSPASACPRRRGTSLSSSLALVAIGACCLLVQSSVFWLHRYAHVERERLQEVKRVLLLEPTALAVEPQP